MTELSVVWSSGKTPVQGCLSSCALMIWELQAQRAGLFDLRAESVILTAWHTIARIHRGAA